MLCVATNNRATLDTIGKWTTEIRQICMDTPIVLVGTKSDLRSDVANPITLNELKAK